MARLIDVQVIQRIVHYGNVTLRILCTYSNEKSVTREVSVFRYKALQNLAKLNRDEFKDYCRLHMSVFPQDGR